MRNQKPRLALSLSRNLVEEEEEAALVKGRGEKYKHKCNCEIPYVKLFRCNKSDSSSSSEDETAVVKASRERKKNPMVQKSHLFKKHRTDDKDDDDSDEVENAATKGFGSTGVSYKTTGAELKNEMKENTFATREVDTAMDRDQRTIEERREEVMKATEGKEDDKVYRGLNNYAQYIEKREAIQGKRLATKGPIRSQISCSQHLIYNFI